MPSIPRPPTARPSSTRLSFSGWLDSLHLCAEARFVVQQANTALYNAELTDLSMLFIAQQAAAMAGIPASSSETMRVAGGNARLPQAIAAELGAALVLDAPVTAVRAPATWCTRDRA